MENLKDNVLDEFLEKEKVEGDSKSSDLEKPIVLSDGQLSLFGVEAVVEESKPVESTSASKPSKSETKKEKSKTKGKEGNKSSKPKKKEDIEVEGDWTVHYATNSFRVSDFFDEMPESGKVTLEQLRAAMEQEFFEMTKQRVKWDYDTGTKRLYPDVSGTSKGCI